MQSEFLFSKKSILQHGLKSCLPAIVLMIFISTPASAQQKSLWSDVAETKIRAAQGARMIVPRVYRTVALNQSTLKSLLKSLPMESSVAIRNSGKTITLPMPDGSYQNFRVVESPVMEPALMKKYPEIKTYSGQGIEDPAATVRFDWTPKGFHAMILSPKGTVFIDPYSKGDVANYISYYKKDFVPAGRKNFSEEASGEDILKMKSAPQKKVPDYAGKELVSSGTQLHTYRLALAADHNYTTFQGGTKALALAAMVTTMNRVNGVYEKEVSVHMNIIAGDDALIYLTAAGDPYTASGACDLRPQNQTNIDAVTGSANYDIGHLFAMSAGGCAVNNSVCNNSLKAYGVTGNSSPVGDPFDIDYVAHEMGHQFNCPHTWNGTQGSCSAGQYAAGSAYEPGSGTTIMSYAGICGSDDLQPHSDAFFASKSFDDIVAYTSTGTASACGVATPTGNNAPAVNAGPGGFTIPKSTPFTLTGSGSDPDGDPLTFEYEEFDLGPAGAPNSPSGNAPIFRFFPPGNLPTRTFPKLSDILNNTQTLGEILPGYTRTLNFRLTARDNRAGGGGVAYASVSLNVDGASGPFVVTSPNTAVAWCPGVHTVTWDVANTNVAPVNVANVKILMSSDGGNTFPTVLVASTPNNGSAPVTIPCTISNQARIKVEAIGNVFFDISNVNFTTGDNIPPTFTAPPNVTIFKDANCNYTVPVATTGDVTNEADNCDATLNATFTDAVANGTCEGELIMTRKWTLTDDCGNTTVHNQTITVTDKTPPTFTAPPAITIYKDANCNQNVTVSVTGDVTDEADNCDHTLNAVFTDGAPVPGSCVGNETITRKWTLTDDCGNSTSHNQLITVKDTTAPVIANITATPSSLWPPDHKMNKVLIGYTAVDNCSPPAKVTTALKVASNEPVNGTGDGDTAPDWIVQDNHQVSIRAERAGTGNGRIYTIFITATDDCGNKSMDSTHVIVNHDNSLAVVRILPAQENVAGLEGKVFPNPGTGIFNVVVKSNNSTEKVVMKVTDVYGRLLEIKTVNANSTTSIGSGYAPGGYFVQLIQGKQHQQMKLIKTMKR
ncbi:M12 family metallo-peptidase [Ferruginibacter paludis]|uniref:reprolysin-like metallopeptidase n=1 Tax=Ferruginibacter paludis TaxID=1310417 RepID=UPI0025B33A7E|nr:zinc-dependent metalloprotease family protein [Ferruginibacter paludis]MDN3655524.1 M12 family metallo-peptidase [Ferruginibacter paludis]